MSPGALVAVSVVVALASLGSVVTGFGFALFVTPVLAWLIGAADAVVAVSLLSLVLTGGMAVRLRHRAARPVATRMFLASVVGMPLGLVVLVGVDDRLLTIGIAVAVLVSVWLLVRGVRLPVHGRLGEAAAGFVSGVLATSTGTNGPPLVITLQAKGLSPLAFRATLAVLFAASRVVALGLMAVGGAITRGALAAAAVGVPALLVGSAGGEAVFRRLDAEVFRHLVLATLVVSASVALVGAVVEG